MAKKTVFHAILYSATKQSKLKRHLQQKHLEHVEKDLNFFEREKTLVKTAKTGC